jgi:hypothetical protein
MKKNNTTFILGCVILLLSCQTQPFPYSKKKAKELQEFREILNQTKEQAKQYLVNDINERTDLNWLEDDCKAKFSNKDTASMYMETVPVYRIDSVAFFHYKNITDVIKSSKLEPRNANFYLRNDTIFISDFRSVLRDNQWKSGGGFCGIYPNLSKKLISVYSQGYPVYNIKVFETTTRAHYYDMPDYSFNVYDNGKELIVIKINGDETSLIGELNKERENLKAFYKDGSIR